MKSGIYRIINVVNGKFYLGSAVNMEHRFTTHRWNLDRNQHPNKYLQSAWNKYGFENFEFVKIEHCERKFLLVKEQAWIDWTKCYNREIGYNSRKLANSNAGIKWTEKRKLEWSIIMKKFRHTEKAKAGMRGRIKTPEEIYKNSQARIGQTRSQETKDKIRIANTGLTRNGKDDKWPHKDRSKCKCKECRAKKTEYLRNWLKTTNKKYIKKNKNYEIINVQTI